MTFDELVAEVYLITNRPDRTAETISAVKAATLKAHKYDFYSKDIYETGVEFTEAAYKQSLDYISLLSNFRAFKYVKRVTDEYDEVGVPIEIVTPEEVLDSYGCLRSDIAYVAGRVLEIRASVPFSKLLLGCYVHPVIRTGAYTSWIAEQHPFLIIHEAARRIFISLGQLEEANGQRQLMLEELQELDTSAIHDKGF